MSVTDLAGFAGDEGRRRPAGAGEGALGDRARQPRARVQQIGGRAGGAAPVVAVSDIVPGRMIIAINGPAGAGKSTIARAIAARLGFAFLDTGALYRCAVLAGVRRNAAPEDIVAGTRHRARRAHTARWRGCHRRDPRPRDQRADADGGCPPRAPCGADAEADRAHVPRGLGGGGSRSVRSSCPTPMSRCSSPPLSRRGPGAVLRSTTSMSRGCVAPCSHETGWTASESTDLAAAPDAIEIDTTEMTRTMPWRRCWSFVPVPYTLASAHSRVELVVSRRRDAPGAPYSPSFVARSTVSSALAVGVAFVAVGRSCPPARRPDKTSVSTAERPATQRRGRTAACRVRPHGAHFAH